MFSNMDKKYEIKMADVEANIKSLIKKENMYDKSLNDIRLKLKDFNVLEIFKSIGNNTENGQNNNILLSLIDNLDKNFNSKIKITEEKMSKIDEANFKMIKDVQNIKNAQDFNNRNIENNKKTIEEIYIKLKDIEKTISNDINIISNQNINTENIPTNNNINLSETKKSENKSKFSEKNVKKEADKNNSIIINEDIKEEINKNIDEKMKEIIKRIIDIEKSFKFLPNQEWVEDIKKEINHIKENTNKFALNSDLNESNNKSEEMRKEIKMLREQYEDLSNNQVLNEDIQSLKRKLELFNNKIQEIEEYCENLENKLTSNINSKILINESNKKLLEIKIFEEFKSQIIKEFTNVNDNFTHLRKLVDDILNTLKNKSSYKDLKSLEDEIIIKLEDLRLSSAKKFAERVETIKNFKYLDQQIKHITQVYIKKLDKSENWLIAKKPINSNICASCESYIGDLKDNSPYVPWNKYPLRDQGDKIYRLGNGFSKMLQMIQVDENNKKPVNNNNPNELSEFVKKMRTEKSDMDIINGDLSLNKTATNNWFKSPQKNLPKIKKGMLIKNKSGINIAESINSTNTNLNNINNVNKNNNNDNTGHGVGPSGSFDNIIHDGESKNNQAELFIEEDEFMSSPKITKIKKTIKK